jgi:diacylglycerol kinase (ATP)
MKLKMIYNPMAGRGRARKHVGKGLAYLREHGDDVDCVPSASPADLTRIAAESSRGEWDRVVVCGGDGSLHLAVRDFDLQRGTLALLPLGSGDDFARVAGIPRTIIGACDAILYGKTREVDVATANGLRYLGVAGLGFDSEVAEYASENAKFLRGSLVYLYSILRVLPRFTPHRVRMNSMRSEEIMFACVGNTRQYGGGIRITPSARIDDGLLDLCLVHRTTRVQLLRTLPRAYTGSHVESPFVETARAPQFTFESERPMDVYADGERLTRTPVTFALATRKLRIVVP